MGENGGHRSHADSSRPDSPRPPSPRPDSPPPPSRRSQEHGAALSARGPGAGPRRERPRPARRRPRRSAGNTSLETAAQAFRMLTTGPAPLALDGAGIGHGLPRRVMALDELRAILLHRSTGRAARDAAWRRIVQEARTGGSAWVVGAVGVALPALQAMAADLEEGYRGDAADVHAAILVGFVAALHRVDLDRPGVITRLRWAAYRAGLLARYTRDGLPGVPLPSPESAPPPYPWAHPDLLLADAVAKGVLSALQAELIGRSRLEEVTLKQAAAELGVGYEAARKARQRGEARLVTAISSGDVERRLSPPAPKSGLSSVRAAAGSEPGSGRKPAGVRGQSAESDGTPDSADPLPEGGAFCSPARQPQPQPRPPSSPRPGTGQPRRRRSGRQRGGTGPGEGAP